MENVKNAKIYSRIPHLDDDLEMKVPSSQAIDLLDCHSNVVSGIIEHATVVPHPLAVRTNDSVFSRALWQERASWMAYRIHHGIENDGARLVRVHGQTPNGDRDCYYDCAKGHLMDCLLRVAFGGPTRHPYALKQLLKQPIHRF